jgi:hypothetical protein
MSLPYIAAEGNASQEQLNNLNYSNTRSGVQDVSLFLKYNLTSTTLENLAYD